jgi:hypothetical protein
MACRYVELAAALAISFWTLVGSVGLSMLGKGRWRLFMPAWAAACLFVDYLIFMLEMD